MLKKFISMAIAVIMLFSLTACSKSDNKNNAKSESNVPLDGFVFKGNGSDKETVELGTPNTKLDPELIYSKLTYTPAMFHGDYRLLGGEDAQKKFGTECQYTKCIHGDKECEITVLPFRIRCGEKTMSHSVNFIKEYNWMELSFMRKYDNGQCSLYTIICAYTVEGNKLKITPLNTFNVDKENNKITYKFSDVIWEYTFAFKGRNLTLVSGENSITLTTGLDPYGKFDYFHVDHYLCKNSKAVSTIDQIVFRYDAEDKESNLSFKTTDGIGSYNSIAVLQENGIFTFTLSLEESTTTYQYVYFYGGNDGLILTDGTNTYYYNDTYADRNKSILNDYLTEDQTSKLDDLSDSKLEAIVEKKENLMEDLATAFNNAGIKVTVDEKTGELAMDSSVLFGGDSSVLTSEGKNFLNKFVDTYMSIVFSEKYKGFVSKTMVEGHTAPIAGSTYESGLPLSEERANNVKNYCLSSETGVDTSRLATALEAVGYSNSKPVVNDGGNVDMAASRRVSFRFMINLDQQ